MVGRSGAGPPTEPERDALRERRRAGVELVLAAVVRDLLDRSPGSYLVARNREVVSARDGWAAIYDATQQLLEDMRGCRGRRVVAGRAVEVAAAAARFVLDLGLTGALDEPGARLRGVVYVAPEIDWGVIERDFPEWVARLRARAEEGGRSVLPYPVCGCGHRFDHHRDPGDSRGGGCWLCECRDYAPEGEKIPSPPA